MDYLAWVIQKLDSILISLNQSQWISTESTFLDLFDMSDGEGEFLCQHFCQKNRLQWNNVVLTSWMLGQRKVGTATKALETRVWLLP